LQVGVPVVVLHARPHPEQFVTELSCVSQPSVFGAVSALQSPNPLAQVYPHFVPSQVAPEALLRLHLFPHAPQLSTLVASVSQPSVFGAVAALQSSLPNAHA
jgi:hypothetical protein